MTFLIGFGPNIAFPCDERGEQLKNLRFAKKIFLSQANAYTKTRHTGMIILLLRIRTNVIRQRQRSNKKPSQIIANDRNELFEHCAMTKNFSLPFHRFSLIALPVFMVAKIVSRESRLNIYNWYDMRRIYKYTRTCKLNSRPCFCHCRARLSRHFGCIATLSLSSSNHTVQSI